MMRRWKVSRLSVILLLAVEGGAPILPRAWSAPPTQGLDQAKLKSVVAAYLVNFANHIHWPDGAMAPNDPLTLAIFGRDPFGETLDQLLVGKTASGHPLRVVRATRVEDLANCQIVFMDQPKRAQSEEVAKAVADRPVLVVSFEPEGRSSSAAIDLVLMKDDTLRYKLAIRHLKSAGLSPSAGLLQFALHGEPRPLSDDRLPP